MDEVSVKFKGAWNAMGRFSLKVVDVHIEFKSLDPAVSQQVVLERPCTATSTLLAASFSILDCVKLLQY